MKTLCCVSAFVKEGRTPQQARAVSGRLRKGPADRVAVVHDPIPGQRNGLFAFHCGCAEEIWQCRWEKQGEASSAEPFSIREKEYFPWLWHYLFPEKRFPAREVNHFARAFRRNIERERTVQRGKMKKLLISIIRLYQRLISPFLPPSCRFEPSCSRYAHTVIDKYGAIIGILYATIRILKCQPLHPGGYDPVN